MSLVANAKNIHWQDSDDTGVLRTSRRRKHVTNRATHQRHRAFWPAWFSWRGDGKDGGWEENGTLKRIRGRLCYFGNQFQNKSILPALSKNFQGLFDGQLCMMAMIERVQSLLEKPLVDECASLQSQGRLASAKTVPGLCGLLPSASASSLEMDNIAEDVTAKRETLVDVPLQSVLSRPTDSTIDFTKLQSMLMDASKGVTEGMDS
ncbi:hypothetical protein EV424DRAFT_1348245 [Suillus variegatus]|nr:hypothetical protein EV424DRAFT_1348245 [Suillus variegatus]